VSDEFDPGAHFPRQEIFEDFAGRMRGFSIECHFNGIGFTVRARENGNSVSGYEFAVYSETSWSNALGRLRRKIRRELATRYLSRSHGYPRLLHDRMKGRITYDSERGVGIVVDGTELTLDEFAQLLGTYEGWEFELTIVDSLE
jgi:hypothetical protein